MSRQPAPVGVARAASGNPYHRGVHVTSLGFSTDLALLELGGSEIEDHDDYLVVRTPHNPTFWWGNFLLLSGPPPPEQTARWLATFASAFPGARHLAFGFDGVDGTVTDLAEFAAAGLNVEASTVMTAKDVHPPDRPNETAVCRVLSSDDDWSQQIELRIACNDRDPDDAAHRTFATAHTNTMRALVADDRGAWFGAFVDGRLLSSMGLFNAAPGVARFQSVETHPAARRQGLATTLVYHVSRYGFDELRAGTLVMVADPDYSAIRIYRAVGFEGTETQLQADRPPLPASDPSVG
jgi:ribosomal protein S18 acetylase RimI-like enzyme